MKMPMKSEGLSIGAIFAVGMSLNIAIGCIDFLTGHDIGLTVFYLLPIGYVTWFADRKMGYLMSAVGIFTSVLGDLFAGKIFLNLAIEVWNALVHLGFFVVVAYLLSRLRFELDGRNRIIAELKTALNEIKTLSGLLPMCAWCKKVRDDSGYWKQVEQYIAEHTEAEFTHGICPDCLKKMEPELYEKIVKPRDEPDDEKK